MTKWFLLPGVFACVAGLAIGQVQPTFRVGTRLVQLDVGVLNDKTPVRGLTKEEFPLWGESSHPLSGDWPRHRFVAGLRLAWNRFLLVAREQQEPEMNRLRRRVLRPIYYALSLTIALFPTLWLAHKICR